jgi:hypothetical protein
MNPIRLVAKLTARGVAIDGAGGGGGPVLISATDVGAALGMGRLKPEAILVGRAKFCDDNTAQLELAGWVQTELHRRCQRAGWKTDYCEGLAQLCVFELVWPYRCTHCYGRGKVWIQQPERRTEDQDSAAPLVMVDRWLSCGRCKGTGQGRMSVRERSAVAQIGKSQFRDAWAKRADDMLAELHSLEESCLRHLWRQFADDAA